MLHNLVECTIINTRQLYLIPRGRVHVKKDHHGNRRSCTAVRH